MNKGIWKKKQGFIIFGAGELGINLMLLLKRYESFLCFIDNDITKQKNGCMNNLVLSLQLCMEKYLGYKIILASSLNNKEALKNQLTCMGLKEGNDFLYINDFMREILPIYIWENFNEVYMSLAQICVTERCTLKCKKCAHGCYAISKNNNDMSLIDVKYSADCFFSHIDYIDKFHLIGGEPLLYQYLADAITYIGDKYIKQIQTLCITTNGTILPNKEILTACKKYNVKILISNYSYTLPKLHSQYDRLIKLLKEYKIDYVFSDAELIWTDYGFDHVDRGFFKENIDEKIRKYSLEKVFNVCKTPCREVRGNKLYYCVQARACAENLGFNVGQDDYLDLNKIYNSIDEKKHLIDFEIGNIEKGYLDMCNYCYGLERFDYIIPAAEQKEY